LAAFIGDASVRQARVQNAIRRIEGAGGEIIFNSSGFYADDGFSFVRRLTGDYPRGVWARRVAPADLAIILDNLPTLSDIEEVMIYRPVDPSTIEGIGRLRTLPCLRELSLSEVDDGFLKGLCELKQLEELTITSSPLVSVESLEQIGALESLRLLNLAYTKADDRTAAVIGKLPHLEELYLMGTEVSDQGVARLSGSTRLRVLDLTETPVTDRCLASIRRLEALETLNLIRTDVEEENFEELRELRRLSELTVPQLHFDAAGIPRIQAAFPDCKLRSQSEIRPLISETSDVMGKWIEIPAPGGPSQAD